MQKTNSLTSFRDLQPNNQKKSFHFIWELAKVLIKSYVTSRYQNRISLQQPSLAAMRYVLNTDTEVATDKSVIASQPTKQKRCYLSLEEISGVSGPKQMKNKLAKVKYDCEIQVEISILL